MGESLIQYGKGLDIGTVNLLASEQNEKGDVVVRMKRNAFLDVPMDTYSKNMLTRLNVPYVVQNKKMFVLGDNAFKLANVLNKSTRRPMKDGLISPKETEALPIMKLLIGSILGEPRSEGEVCVYSVPGESIDSDLSVADHKDLFDAVLQGLGYKPQNILEGHAVVFAELAKEEFTGIGISFGGGMCNVCVSSKSTPALSFSTSRGGDWIDDSVARVLGVKPTKAALWKEKGVDLKDPKTREGDAIAIYYRTLIDYTLTNLVERFRSSENMPAFPEPVVLVLSGGTSLSGGFVDLVRNVLDSIENFPIPIREVRRAEDPLHAVVRGARTAAVFATAEN